MKDRKELKQAIIQRDLDTLKEFAERRMPTVIAFVDIENKEPTSYFVVGVGSLSNEEYKEYQKQSKVERRKR